jgi:hypothetical protein
MFLSSLVLVFILYGLSPCHGSDGYGLWRCRLWTIFFVGSVVGTWANHKWKKESLSRNQIATIYKNQK